MAGLLDGWVLRKGSRYRCGTKQILAPRPAAATAASRRHVAPPKESAPTLTAAALFERPIADVHHPTITSHGDLIMAADNGHLWTTLSRPRSHQVKEHPG